MLKKITITNFQGESMDYLIEGVEQDNPSGLIITKIDGLGPAKANINMTNIVTNDGGLFNSARLNNRNIVITALYTHKYSIEQARLLTYKYFPIKSKVTIVVETDYRKAQTTGYVESNEPFIFEEESYCQISIQCEDPYFVDVSELGKQVISVSNTVKLFEFPFESGAGQEMEYTSDLSVDLVREWNNPNRKATYLETIVSRRSGGVVIGSGTAEWRDVYVNGWVNQREHEISGDSMFRIDDTSAINSATLSNKSIKSLTISGTGSNCGSSSLIRYGMSSTGTDHRLIFDVTDLSGAATTNAKVIVKDSESNIITQRVIHTGGRYDMTYTVTGQYYVEFYVTGSSSATGSMALDNVHIRRINTSDSDIWTYCFPADTNAQYSIVNLTGRNEVSFQFDSLFGSDQQNTTKELEIVMAKFVAPGNQVYMRTFEGDWYLDGCTYEVRDDTTGVVVNTRSTSVAEDLYLNHLTPGKTYNVTLCMPSGQIIYLPAGSPGVWIPPVELYTLTAGDIELGDVTKNRLSNVEYTGDMTIGFTIILTATDTVRNITLFDVITGDTMTIDTSKIRSIVGGSTSHMVGGDEIEICTINGKKHATLTRSGKRYNILNTLNKDCVWFQLNPGNNRYSYEVEDGQDNLYMKFIVDRVFEGV